MSTPAVRIDGLTQTFRSGRDLVTAVDDLSLRIDPGEIVALLGPNGAGKTTTLDVVLGLTAPTRGRVEVTGLPPREAVARGRISAVLQSASLLGDLRVRETVEWIASLFAETMPVDEALRRAGLSDLAGRRVSRLSGGEEQRLRFALALLPDPELLVLDEPTAGMDVSGRHTFWAAMREEADRGRTVVFATHYLEEAETFASRIVLVARGRLVADGTVDEIRDRVAGRRVEVSVGDALGMRGLHDALAAAGVPGEVAPAPGRPGRALVSTADSDAAARVLLGLPGVHDLLVSARSLDDAFVALTAGSGSTAAADADLAEGALR